MNVLMENGPRCPNCQIKLSCYPVSGGYDHYECPACGFQTTGTNMQRNIIEEDCEEYYEEYESDNELIDEFNNNNKQQLLNI